MTTQNIPLSTRLFNFDKYFYLGKRIGAGAFGVVYIIQSRDRDHDHNRDRSTQEVYALKLLRSNKENITAIETFRTEASVLTGKSLTRSIQYYWFGVVQINKRTYYGICMEYFDGITLLEYVRQYRKFSPMSNLGAIHDSDPGPLMLRPEMSYDLFLLRLMSEVSLAIQELHENDIVHRDIKPENILVSSTPDKFEVKLIDFGLAGTKDGPCQARSFKGTPHYVSLTIFQLLATLPPKEPTFEEMKDGSVWALGVTFFVLANFTVPYAPDSSQCKIIGASVLGNEKSEVSNSLTPFMNKIIDMCISRSTRPSLVQILQEIQSAQARILSDSLRLVP